MDQPSHGAHEDKVYPWAYDLTSFWERFESPCLLTRVLVVSPGSRICCPVSLAVCCCSLHSTSHVVSELACAILSNLVTVHRCFKATLVIWEGIKKGFLSGTPNQWEGCEETGLGLAELAFSLHRKPSSSSSRCKDLRSGVTKGAGSWKSMGTAGGSQGRWVHSLHPGWVCALLFPQPLQPRTLASHIFQESNIYCGEIFCLGTMLAKSQVLRWHCCPLCFVLRLWASWCTICPPVETIGREMHIWRAVPQCHPPVPGVKALC